MFAKCNVNEVKAQCGRVFIIGDEREKYSYDKKLKVIRMYLEGMRIRSIERIEGISTPLILKWIKNISKIIKDNYPVRLDTMAIDPSAALYNEGLKYKLGEVAISIKKRESGKQLFILDQKVI